MANQPALQAAATTVSATKGAKSQKRLPRAAPGLASSMAFSVESRLASWYPRGPAMGAAGLHQAGEELWVFGYGSLMWRPGFPYLERCHAHLRGYHRALCIFSHVHRG